MIYYIKVDETTNIIESINSTSDENKTGIIIIPQEVVDKFLRREYKLGKTRLDEIEYENLK